MIFLVAIIALALLPSAIETLGMLLSVLLPLGALAILVGLITLMVIK